MLMLFEILLLPATATFQISAIADRGLWIVYSSCFLELYLLETGLGWDPMRQTINASNEWWDKKLKLERICSAVENRSSISSKGDKPGCSIAEVMKIIRGMPEVKNDFELYMKATDIMVVKENRDMFVALEDPIDQIAWLKHKHV
ncbi:hypothetical protein CK203_095660 [Vitis vinifera]|uniref:Uncharacterized protein n=1 Tax=Vitis vinifera TaxID=29760 RepID=A0A438EMG8_VITVI|nr:hypothetical protein CK203_095660 [Vitis vinifera]